MNIVLYKLNANGTPWEWAIRAERNQLIIEYGQLDGSIQTKVETVELNMSGRDMEAQVALRFNSRVQKQIDKGYCYSLAEAENSRGLNALKLDKPMLAQKFKDVKDINFKSAWMQYKFNGHRCLITCREGVKIAYSRNGKILDTIPHILDSVNVQEGDTLDGELYCHGMKLQTIASLAKRAQPDTKLLSYIVYDIIEGSILTGYATRRQKIGECLDGKVSFIAKTWQFNDREPIKPILNQVISEGYEGLILRQNNYEYEPGVRSKSLIKIKKCMDQEFLVLDVEPSKDGWGILICKVGNSTFRVAAPGSMENKYKILRDKAGYIGRYITVEFFEWTIDQKPFHPVARARLELQSPRLLRRFEAPCRP